MNFRQLRTYVEVVRQGSLSEAARALGLSQPGVSKQIRRLEEELGLPLLVRDERGVVSLTVAGQVFLRYAEDTLRAHQAMRQQLQQLQEELTGSLFLAASTTPGECILPRLLAAFRTRFPHVEARLTIANSREVADRVSAGEFDLGFIGAPIERPHLTLEPFVTDEIVLAVPPDHPFARRESITWEELKEQPLILREAGSGTLRSVEQALAAQGKHLPRENAVLVLGSAQAVVRAVRDGLGVGFVSAFALPGPEPGEPRPVRIAGLPLRRQLYIIYDAGRVQSRLQRAFLAFVREWAAKREDDDARS